MQCLPLTSDHHVFDFLQSTNLDYIARRLGLENSHLARERVDALPFGGGRFMNDHDFHQGNGLVCPGQGVRDRGMDPVRTHGGGPGKGPARTRRPVSSPLPEAPFQIRFVNPSTPLEEVTGDGAHTRDR